MVLYLVVRLGVQVAEMGFYLFVFRSASQMINKKCRKRSHYPTGENRYWSSVCDPKGHKCLNNSS